MEDMRTRVVHDDTSPCLFVYRSTPTPCDTIVSVSAHKKVDKIFLSVTLLLISVGFFIFLSAALGLLARGGIPLSAVIINQIVGLVVGTLLLLITMRIHPSFWNKYAFFIFVGAAVLTLFVLIPNLGFTHGGATRWLSLGPFSFQPGELLKISFVLYFAAWIAGTKQKIQTIRFGVLPFVALVGIVGAILIAQPDLGTFLVIAGAGAGMFLAGGGRWSHAFILAVIGVVLLATLAYFIPYVSLRLNTFLHPESDSLGAGYQVQQSLIAIGSGGIFGRGFGQSVQKFNFLPEPVGDSIFAVFAEEWGLVGVLVLLALFLIFALRGFRIASRAPTVFSSLATVGIILLVIIQSLINIASMLGIFPLTGMPLLFVSQGGSALMATMAAVGIVLSISRHQKRL